LKENIIIKTKRVSKRSIGLKVKNGVRENIALETEKMNTTDKPLSPDLLLQMALPPPLTVWIAQWWAGRSATKRAL
jgi:hypothetical protein